MYGELLSAELQRLNELPQVRLTDGALFDRARPKGSDPHKRGVICRLLCCGGQLDVKCNGRSGPGACATHADAARLLREKVAAKHGSEACLAKARQAAEAAPPENAFALMLGAQIARQRACSALKQAQEDAEQKSKRAALAVQESQEAQQSLAEAEDEARRAGVLTAKKQKAAPRPPHFETYSNYNESKWLSTTGEIMNRRAVEPKHLVVAPAPREGAEGALLHWRRGLAGCVQDWAAGSLDNVVILILRLVVASPPMPRCCHAHQCHLC